MCWCSVEGIAKSHIRPNDKNSVQHKIASLFSAEIINYSNEDRGTQRKRESETVTGLENI